MISAIRGILELKGNNVAIVRVGGISFQVNVPALTLARLGKIGAEVRLHTHLYWKADNIALYGFGSTEELAFFQSLLGVGGVGPKTALALLSALTPDRLSTAVMSEDAAMLSQVPGIGKKTASRIILELKSKLEKGGVLPAGITTDKSEVIAALTSLGYSTLEAARAADGLPDTDLSLEEKVKLALKNIGSR